MVDIGKSTGQTSTATDKMLAAEKQLRDIALEVKRLHEEHGDLGLPPLLAERRLEYGIPDGNFEFQTVFDRILVYQVDRYTGDTYGEGSLIHMPHTHRESEKQMAPRGILVAAGLTALDQLRSHGVDLGHLVTFIRLAPYRYPTGRILGRETYSILMRAGDILGSEDLCQAMKNGECKIDDRKNEDGIIEHVFVDKDGKIWEPNSPFIGDDY